MKRKQLIAAILSTAVMMPTLAKGATTLHENGFNRISIGYLDFRLIDRASVTTLEKIAKTENNISSKHINLNGFYAEYLHGFKIPNNPFYVETGARISYNRKTLGSSDSFTPALKIDRGLWKVFPNFLEDDNTKKHIIDFFSITIPVNISYKYNICDNFAIQPFVGLYGKYHMIGHVKANGYYIENYNFKREWVFNLFRRDDMKGEIFKRFQFGIQTGFGFSVDRLYFGMSFGYDITPLYNQSQFNEKLSSCEWAAQIGFNF